VEIIIVLDSPINVIQINHQYLNNHLHETAKRNRVHKQIT